MKTAVLYHGDADGFGAAYVLWTLRKDKAIYLPVQYGQPVPELSESIENLFIVDFSYDKETLLSLQSKYHLEVIDHHKTSAEAVKAVGGAHDESTAGCVLTWESFYLSTPPELLRYIADRDLWRWELEKSEEVNLFIATLPFDFEVWDEWAKCEDFFYQAVSAGTAIKAFRDRQIASALKSVRMLELVCEVGTFEVPVVNATTNISELGNELCRQYPNAPFSASYCDREDVRTWSLRSIGAFDVSAVARSCGGGGHRNAAGFTTELGWPGFISTDFREGFEDASA